MFSWFDTGWLFYSGADQGGSVHGDIELSGTINGWGAGFRVYLWVVRWQPGSLLQFWVKMWTYAIPGSINTAVDLGISPWDRSLPGGLPFQWVSGFFYYTRVIIQAFASSNTQASCDARFDDILWSTYTSSLEPHWIHSSDPEIALDPPMGPVETRVDIVGTGFAPESIVYVYFDDNLVAESLTTPEGVFKSWFNVPSQSRKGPHTLRAIDQLENSGISFFDVFIEAPPVAGDLNGDGVVNINDASLVGINWLKADPNVDPPEEASATDIFPSASGFALIAIVAIGFLKLRKKLGRLVS